METRGITEKQAKKTDGNRMRIEKAVLIPMVYSTAFLFKQVNVPESYVRMGKR